jgi:hypothetical protein
MRKNWSLEIKTPIFRHVEPGSHSSLSTEKKKNLIRVRGAVKESEWGGFRMGVEASVGLIDQPND